MQSSILLWIRWRQIRKELTGAGLVYALLVLLIAFCLSVFLYTRFARSPDAFIYAALIPAAVLSLHLGRKDKAFVHQHCVQPVRAMYAEYAVFTLPFTAVALATPHWFLFPVMQVVIYGIAHIRATPVARAGMLFLSGIIAPRDFEWLGGIRKSAAAFFFLYLAACGLCWLQFAPLICLWLLTVQITSFYLECEPMALLWSNAGTPVQLLHSKIRRQGLMLLVLSAPVLFCHSLFCPDMTLINLCFLIAQLLLLVFAILMKYATYEPGRLMSGNQLLLGLAAISIVIPFLLPVPVLLSIRNYRRALARLKTYTYDPHS